MSEITCLAPWFGSNRMLAPVVGQELRGCEWVGIPFAGGMSEVLHIDARTIVVNDLHRAVMNLASVVSIPAFKDRLVTALDKLLFHPDVLFAAQSHCIEMERGGWTFGNIDTELSERWALNYFVTCWMSRSSKSGTDDEFKGSLPLRWDAGGGDSNVRYRSAIEMLDTFGETFRRCTFSTLDVFQFIAKVKDRAGHGVYCDQPFPGPGEAYKHKFSIQETRRLATVLSTYRETRIVCRFYEHQLVRECYPEPQWTYRALTGRKQSNDAAQELLVINGRSFAT